MSLMLALLLAQETWPGSSWTTATPAQAGMDAAKLQQARDYALTGGGSGMITRGGSLVMSWGNAATKYDLKSTTKSFGATALGLGVKDGKISLGQKAQAYHPSLGVPPSSNTGTGWLDDITIKHLATQTAGFDKSGGYTALLFQPGTKWSYSDGGPNWLAECLTLVYKQDLNTLMWSRVFTPLGIPAAELSWRNNQYRPDTINGYKNREFGAGISASVNALARMGLLHLRDGRWSSGQILPASYVDLVRQTPPEVKGLPVTLPGTYDDASNHYGLLWWNNNDGKIPTVPKDAYWSWGLYDSWILVIPSLDIVASRAGESLQSGWAGHYGVIRPFAEPIAQSVQATAPPLPSSTQKIWLAAKNGTRSGAMARSTTYAAGSLAGELVYPNLNVYNTSNTTQADAVTFSNLLVQSSGTWYLWARLYYPGVTAQPTNDPNSFWVAVDGKTALSLGTLSAGEHTLKIWNREARETSTSKLSPRLDAILLTNDAAYVPKDADAPALGGGSGGGAGTSGAPYPASPVITGISWAATSTIVRQATGSDNWPLTWADDGNLYGAYGDGNGFDPKVPSKLSLGFAKIAGGSPGTGTNIRSATGEDTGDGQSGRKASGLLMVGGALYMWVRNDGSNGTQSRLAWSTDHAATWTWASWAFPEFGYLTFVNFGQNYAGARDTYVYCVTHDNPSAYASSDRFVLLRVPKGSVETRSAYEFYRGKDASGNPLWSTDIAQRTAVFTHAPGRCRRSQISYNAALGRYLWWQMYHENGVDQRFAGGFGVYDAPNPWGPWTTVYFTTSWDVGPGETGGFPTKWMSADGKTIHLVFSGDDAFSVRKATVTVAGSSGNAPPSVNVTSPAAGAVFAPGSNVVIQASASDSDGSVSRVEFHVDGVLLGSDTSSPYSLTWSNVQSGSHSITAKAIDNDGASETSAAVAVTVSPPSGGGGIVSGTSPTSYVWDTMGAGKVQYVDRTYTFSSVPAALAGLAFLRTANDDKSSVGSGWITFTLSEAATVYVAHDDRISPRPPWLSGWTDTGLNLVSGGGTFSVFSKAFAAGTVSLGGNVGSGTTIASMYTVLVGPGSDGAPPPFAVKVDFVSTGKAYTSNATAETNALPYVDRSYVITSISAGPSGGVLVRTANDDKAVTAAAHLKLSVNRSAVLYVVYHEIATKNPTWLNDGTWTIVTTETLKVNLHDSVSLRIFRKTVPAGQVTLGGNHHGGDTGARANYFVIAEAAP